MSNIHNIQRLNEEQTDMAKIIAFLTFKILDVTNFPDPFGTVVSFDADANRAMSAEQVFESIVAKRTKSSYLEKEKYATFIREFINNPHNSQFIDLGKYAYFRDVI